MREIGYTITQEMCAKSVLTFLRQTHGYSARLITRLKKSPGAITVNGEHARTVDILKTGDLLFVRIPDSESDIEPVNMPLDIIYEDEDVLVVNKQVGVTVHPTRNHQGDTLANAVAYYLSHKGIKTAFRALNRLDRDTSGAVVIALNEYSACRLQHSVKKEYIAAVQGVIEEKGKIDSPISRVNERSTMRTVSSCGKRAVTNFNRIYTDGKNSLIRCTLETGRTHQIRVHLSSIGHPLAGDDMYSGDTTVLRHQALQCIWVGFTQPVTGEEISLSCPLRQDIVQLFGRSDLEGLCQDKSN